MVEFACGVVAGLVVAALIAWKLGVFDFRAFNP